MDAAAVRLTDVVVGDASDKFFEHYPSFESGHARSQAEVSTQSEAQELARVAFEIVNIGISEDARIAVG